MKYGGPLISRLTEMYPPPKKKLLHVTPPASILPGTGLNYREMRDTIRYTASLDAKFRTAAIPSSHNLASHAERAPMALEEGKDVARRARLHRTRSAPMISSGLIARFTRARQHPPTVPRFPRTAQDTHLSPGHLSPLPASRASVLPRRRGPRTRENEGFLRLETRDTCIPYRLDTCSASSVPRFQPPWLWCCATPLCFRRHRVRSRFPPQ